MTSGFLCNALLNFLLDFKSIIVSKGELCNNNKFKVKFLLSICGLITVKITLYRRVYKIYIDIKSNKPVFY